MGIACPPWAVFRSFCTFRAMLGMAARQAAARPLSCQNKYFNFLDMYDLSPLLLTDCAAFIASILRSSPPKAQIVDVQSNQRPFLPSCTIFILKDACMNSCPVAKSNQD